MSRPAFEIRAHHLSNFAPLLRFGTAPTELADAMIEARKADKAGDDEARSYATDVIGKSTDNARAVSRSFANAFGRFVELSEFDPVLITIGRKDMICDGCHIGAHCLDRGEELAMKTPDGMRRVYAKDIDDMFALSAFLRLGESLISTGSMESRFGLPEELPDYASEPSADAIPIISSNMIEYQLPVSTNAGFVSAVLRHWC